MKLKFLSVSTLAVVIMASSAAIAQDEATSSPALFSKPSAFNTWSFGIQAGVMAPTIPFGENDFTSWKADIGYGAYLKKQILPALGIQASYMGGKLNADNSRLLGNGTAPVSPFDKYETNIAYAGSISANLTLANIHFMNRKSSLHPYLTAGAGLMGYKISLIDNAGAETQFNGGEQVGETFFPVGLGFKIGLSNSTNLDLGYTMNFVDGDNLDGYRAGTENDKFSFAHIGLEFALGSKSKTQLSRYNPVAAMQDDYLSRNAALQAELAAERARNDQRLAQMETDNKRFLMDSDKDGVSDYFDKCPGTPEGVQVDGAGCELKITTVNPVRVVVTEEDRRVVAEAIKNLEFDFGKSSIRSTSYPSLNRVSDLLKTKDFSLKLAGHTDNVGSDAANLKLSKDRAESVKSYLVSQGANASRIEATGYGESQPISTNATAVGRQNNRRVEFTLY